MAQRDIDEIEAFSLTTRLERPAKAGDTVIRVRTIPVGLSGTLIVGAGAASKETVVISSQANRDLTLTAPLANAHNVGEAVIRLDILQDYASERAVSVATYDYDLQAAIDALPAAGGEIFLPPGEILIDTTIDYGGKDSITLVGAAITGQNGPVTKLRWTGADGGLMFNLDGSWSCGFKGVGFYGDNETVYESAGTSTCIQAVSSSQCSLRECYFQNWGVGVTLGSGTTGTDLWSFYHCVFQYGASQVGLRSNSNNAVNNRLFGCLFNSLPTGGAVASKGVDVVDGMFTAYGCITQGNAYGIYITQCAGVIDIFGHHTERDGYAIYTAVYGSDPTLYNRLGLSVDGLFNYESVNGLFYFGDHRYFYDVRNVLSDSAQNHDIVIKTGYEKQLTLTNVIQLQGSSVKDTDGAATVVNGWYGAMGAQIVKHITRGKLIAYQGIGVGNSAACSGPVGNVAGKIEVFDEAGDSLGYLPIYSAIS